MSQHPDGSITRQGHSNARQTVSVTHTPCSMRFTVFDGTEAIELLVARHLSVSSIVAGLSLGSSCSRRAAAPATNAAAKLVPV